MNQFTKNYISETNKLMERMDEVNASGSINITLDQDQLKVCIEALRHTYALLSPECDERKRVGHLIAELGNAFEQ